MVAALGCVSNKTARGWYHSLEARGWGAAFTAGVAAVGASHEAVGSPQEAADSSNEIIFEDALPEVEVAAVFFFAESDEEDLGLDMDYVAKGKMSRLDIWREHPNYSIGIQLAELSTMWLVHGWQVEAFPMFTNWLQQQAPGIIGNLNNSKRFLRSFQPSMVQACHTCTAASLHALVPATGMPTFLSRVIDVVSINGASLLPVIYIHTAPEGGLTWSLLGCPCLEHIPSAVGEKMQPLDPHDGSACIPGSTWSTRCTKWKSPSTYAAQTALIDWRCPSLTRRYRARVPRDSRKKNARWIGYPIRR